MNNTVNNEFSNNDYFLNLPVKVFLKQIEWVRQYYQVISLDDLLSGSSLPPRIALITFDDGFRNIYETAFPILKSLGLPATVFLIGSVVREEKVPWIYRLHWLVDYALENRILISNFTEGEGDSTYRGFSGLLKDLKGMMKKLDVTDIGNMLRNIEKRIDVSLPEDIVAREFLQDNEIKELCRSGWNIGNHTDNHLNLRFLSPERTRAEIVECSKLLSDYSGYRSVLAFPFGGSESFSAETVNIARDTGIEYVFTTMGGLNDYPCSDMILTRIICETFSQSYFSFQASGAKNEIKKTAWSIIRKEYISGQEGK